MPQCEPEALFPLWDERVPFPAFDEMPDLDIVTHVSVEKAQPGGYHYLHESAIAWHHDVLYVCWANHRLSEVNVKDELIRGRRSADGGFTWEPARIWVQAPWGGGESFNHPVLSSNQERLWGFFTRWEAERPDTEVCTLDEATGRWESTGARIPGFLPFRPPMKMGDGNWILGGELFWYESAVAISRGDDFTAWDVVQIPRPEEIRLLFPETALTDQGDRLVAMCRPHQAQTAPVSVSEDCGRTWTPLRLSNLPLAASQPYCSRLSTGQHYLITDNLEQGRALLQIAVTRPGGREFCRVWKLRHQQYPKVRVFGGWGEGSRVEQPTEWSYPAAVEHDGKLYISYTQGKEDCVLSIVPVSVLEA
jgi:hypothetical protein